MRSPVHVAEQACTLLLYVAVSLLHDPHLTVARLKGGFDSRRAPCAYVWVKAYKGRRAACVGQGGKGSRGPAPTNGATASRSGAALEAWRRLAAPVARLLSPALRRTSLLLLLIWFTNALNYYGLVLLTTTVRPVNHTLVLPSPASTMARYCMITPV